MPGDSAEGIGSRHLEWASLPRTSTLWTFLKRYGSWWVARLLGAAEGSTVLAMGSRELRLILRSRAWLRFVGMWLAVAAGMLLLPMLFRSAFGHWREPDNRTWFVLCGNMLQAGITLAMVQWTVRRLRRDLYTDRLDELLLTRSSAADIAMGEGLASATASLWLVAATFPACMFLAALADGGVGAAFRLALSCVPAAMIGVWFGMGWGLAFTLRRSTAFAAMTDWWVKAPLLPMWVGWSMLGSIPVLWAVLELIPGGRVVVGAATATLRWIIFQVVHNWNPVFTINGVIGYGGAAWLTNWLALILVSLFMMRKSMDAIQLSLQSLADRDLPRKERDFWIHHAGHHFTQYGEGKRRQPLYRDGGNPVAAFDVALGHRVFLHPFFWALAIMLYCFLLVWSLLVPRLGAVAGTLAVLVPATGALVLMSGGVAVSFGWERDQRRWPDLAVLGMTDLRIALGKIKGVVRPTLWLALAASLTALLLGWRGALDGQVALWMALHVLVFPVTLACVSATLALTTPTLGEAIYRWAIFGAIPSAASLLPPPIGGAGGLALPFTPPVMVLFLVHHGPTPELIVNAWAAFGLEVIGIVGSLIILGRFLRRWTVGERG